MFFFFFFAIKAYSYSTILNKNPYSLTCLTGGHVNYIAINLTQSEKNQKYIEQQQSCKECLNIGISWLTSTPQNHVGALLKHLSSSLLF